MGARDQAAGLFHIHEDPIQRTNSKETGNPVSGVMPPLDHQCMQTWRDILQVFFESFEKII
jgi:hypothetical protein